MTKTKLKANSIVLIFIGILCFAMLAVAARPRENQFPTDKATDRVSVNRPPPVLRMKQPGSPLTMTEVVVDHSSDPLMPVIHCNIKNKSGKPILVYAVKHEAVFSQRTGTFSGSVLFNPVDRKNPMRPGDTRQVEISGVRYGEMPESVMLSVDFVEFVDGIRWGPDSLKNSERIDGVRAGANAEREALMKVLINEGTEGVLNSLDSITREPNQASPHSVEWLDGFRHGVGWIRARVRSKAQNPSGIEEELRLPVDPKENRR